MMRVVRGSTGDALVATLGDVLSTTPADPFHAETIVVHSWGIERWLSQQLAQRLGASDAYGGVCANVDFRSPADMVNHVSRAVGAKGSDSAAWDTQSVAWHLLAATQSDATNVPAGLRRRVDRAGSRRLVTLRAIAGHLTSYSLHRPDMVLDWLQGHDRNGAGGALDMRDRWQADTMRMLASRITSPAPPQVWASVIQAIVGGADLPRMQRLTLYGFTALPASWLAVLRALSTRIDVNVLVLDPTQTSSPTTMHGRVDDHGFPVMPMRPPLTVLDDRLRHAWGRDVHELDALIQTVSGPDTADTAAPGTADETTDDGSTDGRASAGQATVLQRLQVSIAGSQHSGPIDRGTDDSLQLHSCPGPARQVQVLRDEILRLLAADPTLRPRDIIVMCPDVEAFAPLVMAHLAGGDVGGERPDLRVRLADRSLKQTNAILQGLDALLQMAATRVTRSRLLDLIALAPVRRRFGLSVDDVDTVAGWLEDTDVRWGMDAAARDRAGITGLRSHTVDEGLDRLLLGVAMADEDDRSIGGITPYDDIEGTSVDVAGRLAELAARLTGALQGLRADHDPTAWMSLLTDVVDGLMLAPWDEPGQRQEVTGVLGELLAPDLPRELTITLADVSDLLADRLAGRPSRANHMTGDLTVCTLVPMRSVPHRVVCLLGMDDVVFPRRPRPHVDDLMAAAPRVADHDPRSEDRQLLLDAVMAAKDALVVLWTGSDPRSGEQVPPCVPVAELTRAVDALDDRPGLSDALTHVAPLHAHDRRAFTPARPSFDVLAHRAAGAVPVGDRGRREVALGPEAAPDELTLAELESFLVNPAAGFVRYVLGAWIPKDAEVGEEHLPVEVSGLNMWALGTAFLDAGVPAPQPGGDPIVDTARGRGLLPSEPLRTKKIQKIRETSEGIKALCDKEGLLLGPDAASTVGARSVSLAVAGRTLRGMVPGVFEDRIVQVSYSKTKPKSLVAGWVRLLAMTAAEPETAWSVMLVGRRNNSGGKPSIVRIEPLGSTTSQRRLKADTLLADLVELWADLRRTPYVLPADTAFTWAHSRSEGGSAADADSAAADVWEPDDSGFGCDRTNAANVLVLGGDQPYDVLTAAAPRPQDTPLGADAEPHLFGAMAQRVWKQIIQRQTGMP